MSTSNQLLDPHSTAQFVPEASACMPAIPTPRTCAEIASWARHAAAANGFGDAGAVSADFSQTPVAAPAPERENVWSRLRRFGAELLRGWLADGRRRAGSAALARLDAATLRDLGIDRSEIGSVTAESRGSSQVTRRRIVNHEVLDTRRLRINRVDTFL
jgi:uncharacterized protein YjiS (DUF1127 family)